MNFDVEVVESGFRVVCKWGVDVNGFFVGWYDIILVNNNFYGYISSVVSFLLDLVVGSGVEFFILGFCLVLFGDVVVLV